METGAQEAKREHIGQSFRLILSPCSKRSRAGGSQPQAKGLPTSPLLTVSRPLRGHPSLSVDFGDNLHYRATRIAALDSVKRASQRRSIAQSRKSTWSCYEFDIRVRSCVRGVVLPTPERGELRKALDSIRKGEKVAAIIEGEEVPILRGACIRADQSSNLEQLLSTIPMAPAS